MAKVRTNAVEILPKIWTAWVGCTNVTDRRQTDRRQTDGWQHIPTFTFAKNRYTWLPLFSPPAEGFPSDYLREIFSECHWMAKVPNAIEILPKIWTAWVGCTSVTDRQTDRQTVTDDRQTDDRQSSDVSSRSLYAIYAIFPSLGFCPPPYFTHDVSWAMLNIDCTPLCDLICVLHRSATLSQ